MTTLRRDLRFKINEILNNYLKSGYSYLGEEIPSDLVDKLADAALELLGFKSWEEKQQALHERQEALKDELAENSIEAAIILGKPLAKSAQKVKDSVEFHAMICAELARLPFNFEGDREIEQESFRTFLKSKRKLGQELKTWVDWWMSDEWRVANPPWKLTVIKIKWFEAFKTVEKPTRPEYQKFVAPIEEEFVSNPKAKK